MSFLKSLFGGGKTGDSAPAKPAAQESYKGYLIKAVPMQVGSEHQLAGTIEKEIRGELKSYRFVRADRFGGRDEAASRALAKGQQLIDEQGDRLFS